MKFMRIGRILRPQGIRGELKMEILSEDPSRFSCLSNVYVEQDRCFRPMVVDSCFVRGESAFLTLMNVLTREQAEELRNAYICVPREEAIKLPEGRWFIDDLLGCTIEDITGKTLGKLVDIVQNGAADVYVVKGNVEGQGLLMPALKKLLLKVNIEEKRIVVDENILKQVAIWDWQQGGKPQQE